MSQRLRDFAKRASTSTQNDSPPVEFNEYTPLLNTCSLPSIFTDPGPIGAGGDTFTDGEDAYTTNVDFERRSLQGNGNGTDHVAAATDENGNPLEHGDGSGYPANVHFRRRNRRRRTGTGGPRPRAASAKRAEKKKRPRTHSDTDIRKMRPIIASPFMPTLATQVSVNAVAGLPSTSQDRRKQTSTNATSTSNFVPSQSTTNSGNNNKTPTVSNNNVPAVNNNNNATTSIGIPPTTGGGLSKAVGHAKYGALPLRKAPPTEDGQLPKTTTTGAVPPASSSIVVVSGGGAGDDDESSSDEDEGDEDEESSSSSSSSSSESSVYTRFSDLSKKQWATVGMLAVANLCSTVAFSCIAPFYPGEAKRKGMSPSETGIIFGIFELVMFFSAPLLGKYMAFFGSKRMFTAGLFITGVTAIAFGFLNFLPANRTFFWASLTVRCCEALGDACFVTSSFAISAKCFPGRIATIVGIMETFAGLGYTAGPMIGGVLYEYGGFQLPFLVLGILLIFATVLSYYLVEEIEDEPTEDAMGMISMLKIPVIWLMVFAVVICAISLSFLDPTLADHLSSFNLSTTMVGLMFLVCGGVYTLTAPLWGLLLDRWHCSNALMLFGSSVTVISMIFVGPTPFLNMEKDLVIIGIALAILGLAAGALYIPTFQNCLDAVKENGYDDSFQTYGCVSGVFQSAFAFGAFIGPTLGGFSVQQLGFAWTTTIIGFINLCFIFTLLFLFVMKRFIKKYRALETNDSMISDKNNQRDLV